MRKVLLFTHGTALLWLLSFLALPSGWAVLAATFLSLVHFAATLVLFYSKPDVRKRHAFIGAILPLLLFFSILAGLWFFPGVAPRALLVFFLLVLWHYAKQSYGFFVLSFRGLGAFDRHDSLERQSLLFFFLWAALFSFISAQMVTGAQLAFGVYVQSLGLPPEPFLTVGRVGVGAGLLYCAWLCVRYRRYAPFLTALAFALWCDLRLFDYRFLILLPAFHALQYLPAALWRLKLGNARAGNALVAAVLVCAGLLFVVFHASPRQWPWLITVLAASEITMNLQHYMLDAYLWRARDESVREALGIKDA